MLDLVKEHIERAKKDYKSLQFSEKPDGSIYICIPDYILPEKWKNIKDESNKVELLIILPVGYPSSKPDGFDTDVNLRVNNGVKPTQGCGERQIDGKQWLHFCWQPQEWNHDRENLWRYIKLCERRFVEVIG